MKESSTPPHVVGVELIQDVSGIASPVDGFLRRYRHRVKSILSDGTRTDAFVADYVDRAAGRRDATAVAVYVPHPDPRRSVVLLRQQMRYPVYLASGAPLMTEVVAGIIEGEESPRTTAVREVLEETGLRIGENDVDVLGGPFYSSPGIFTELIHVVAARLPEDALERPLPVALGDGSPMELGARLVAVPLAQALRLPARPPEPSDAMPVLSDAKTEIALRRLYDHLVGGTP